jgi:glutamate synthase domain-containing protein 3
MGLKDVVESAIMEAIDADKIKKELHELIDKHVDDVLHKFKANVLDKLDGEDDIPDV